ncbi:hypothetical protein G6695_06750 [Polynucleobacter paneuropaeus]|nr:hypothetical protein [Polynucleobacter paneuropaeus]
MKLQFFIALAITANFFVISESNAFFFDNKQAIYSCENEEDAKLCNKNCSAIGRDLEVKVDLKQKKILKTYYENGRPIGSSVEKNSSNTECDIFDEKNWVCTTLLQGIGSYSTHSMSNGKYLYKNYGRHKQFSCTK